MIFKWCWKIFKKFRITNYCIKCDIFYRKNYRRYCYGIFYIFWAIKFNISVIIYKIKINLRKKDYNDDIPF